MFAITEKVQKKEYRHLPVQNQRYWNQYQCQYKCEQYLTLINDVHSIRDITHWFVDFHFEASSSHFGHRHLRFSEPEVTIFELELS